MWNLKMQKVLYIICFVFVCISTNITELEAGVKRKADDANLKENTVDAKKQKAQSEEIAVEFIKKIAQEALDIVNQNGTPDDQKRQKLSESINKYLDIERITRAVFSPFKYNELSDENQEKVKKYLAKYLLEFYAGEGKLAAMVDATLAPKLSSESKDNDFAVTTSFQKGDSSVKIVWVTDCYKVYYVEIEGINQITTLRSEMKGNIGESSLMDYINKQTNQKSDQ